MRSKPLYLILILILAFIGVMIWKYATEQDKVLLSEDVYSEQKSEEIRIEALVESDTLDPKLSDNSLLAKYYSSDDFFELALSLLNDSLDGDAESQYFLFQILSECGLNSENTISHVLSTYEALGIPLNLAHIKEVENEVSKCSGFTKNNFSHFYKNNRYEWLKKAADNKYPIAMAAYAKEAIWTLRGDLTFMPKADLKLKSASEMLVQSLKLDEPAVLLEVAQVVESVPEQTAWGLLACRTGYNCKAKSIQIENSAIVMTCLNMKREPDCFEKANLYSFLTLGMNEETIQTAIARSFEIETKLKNNDYRGIGLDSYLEYIKEK